jgi:hypothetical protein
MQDKKLERWQELCAEAAKEQDPQRLAYLAREIERLLAEKEERLRLQRSGNAVA